MTFRGCHWGGWQHTGDACLEIPVDLCIASPFSWQIVIGNAGPASTLQSMGGKLFFRHHFVNIALYTNSKQGKSCFGSKIQVMPLIFC